MRTLVSTLVALSLSAVVAAADPTSVSKVASVTYFSNYEPASPRSLDDIPAPVREKLVAHLKKRLGESFYTSLKFIGGQVVDFDEYHRQEPNWKDLRWEMFAYHLFFAFGLPEKGIESYIASIQLRTDGSIIEEIDLPDIGQHPERAEFVPLASAKKAAATAGFDASKYEVTIDYRQKEDCCVYSFRQLDRQDGAHLYFKCVDIDAHSGKQLRTFEQLAIE